jgi:hypothetical protein
MGSGYVNEMDKIGTTRRSPNTVAFDVRVETQRNFVRKSSKNHNGAQKPSVGLEFGLKQYVKPTSIPN